MDLEQIRHLSTPELRLLLVYAFAGEQPTQESMRLIGIQSRNNYYSVRKRVRELLGSAPQVQRVVPVEHPRTDTRPVSHRDSVGDVIRMWEAHFHTSLSVKQAQEFLNTAPLEEVRRAVEYVSKKGDVRNPYPYTCMVLKSNRKKAATPVSPTTKTTLELEEQEDVGEMREPTEEEVEMLRKEQARAYELLARLGLQ